MEPIEPPTNEEAMLDYATRHGPVAAGLVAIALPNVTQSPVVFDVKDIDFAWFALVSDIGVLSSA